MQEVVESVRPPGSAFGDVVKEVLDLLHSHLPECVVYVTKFDTGANVLRILDTRGDPSPPTSGGRWSLATAPG